MSHLQNIRGEQRNTTDALEEQQGGAEPVGMGAYILGWIMTLLALYLCYRCNTHEMIVLRILYILIAWFFTPYYLVYYLIYGKY